MAAAAAGAVCLSGDGGEYLSVSCSPLQTSVEK